MHLLGRDKVDTEDDPVGRAREVDAVRCQRQSVPSLQVYLLGS